MGSGNVVRAITILSEELGEIMALYMARLFSDTHFKNLVFVFNCGTQSQIYREVGSSLDSLSFKKFYELCNYQVNVGMHTCHMHTHWHVCGDQRIGLQNCLSSSGFTGDQNGPSGCETNVFPHCAPLLTSISLILDSLT